MRGRFQLHLVLSEITFFKKNAANSDEISPIKEPARDSKANKSDLKIKKPDELSKASEGIMSPYTNFNCAYIINATNVKRSLNLQQTCKVAVQLCPFFRKVAAGKKKAAEARLEPGTAHHIFFAIFVMLGQNQEFHTAAN